MDRFNYCSRLFFTFFAFMFFGIGGFLVGISIYPILLVLIRNKSTRNKYGQYVIHWLFKLFVGYMKMTGIFSISITGEEKLQPAGQFFLATHPTLIDVVILLSLIKNVDCVVKAKLMQNPFTSGPLKAAGYIVNSEPQQLIEACTNALQMNRNLLIFPEGTRTKKLNMLRLQRGAAKIAIGAQKDITPIVIKCEPRMLEKNTKWYKIPSTKPQFTVAVGKKINITKFLDGEKSQNIQSRNLTNHLIEYFKGELGIV